jgi:hypothetical protein
MVTFVGPQHALGFYLQSSYKTWHMKVYCFNELYRETELTSQFAKRAVYCAQDGDFMFCSVMRTAYVVLQWWALNNGIWAAVLFYVQESKALTL